MAITQRGQKLAVVLGGIAVALGIFAIVVDLAQGEGLNVPGLVVIAIGLVAIASARRRPAG